MVTLSVYSTFASTSPFPIGTFSPTFGLPPHRHRHSPPFPATWSLRCKVPGWLVLSHVVAFSVRLCSLLATESQVHADSSDSCHLLYMCVRECVCTVPPSMDQMCLKGLKVENDSPKWRQFSRFSLHQEASFGIQLGILQRVCKSMTLDDRKYFVLRV